MLLLLATTVFYSIVWCVPEHNRTPKKNETIGISIGSNGNRIKPIAIKVSKIKFVKHFIKLFFCERTCEAERERERERNSKNGKSE